MFHATPHDGIAWVTGASSGIGRAVALRLAAGGFRVAVTARRADDLAALASAHPGRIFAYPGDVTDRAAVAGIVSAVEATHGAISLALLNAGVYHLGEREAFDPALVWATVETNLGGTINCLAPLLAAMQGRGRGQIALVGSLAGYRAIPGSIAYGASKSAIIYVAEALRMTYARRGLTIQVVNPGFVRTAMTDANPYDMPFMLDADAAARRICAGLAGGGFEITFPRRLAWPAKFAAALPHALFAPLMRRAARRTETQVTPPGR